jgi:hypothetical protein
MPNLRDNQPAISGSVVAGGQVFTSTGVGGSPQICFGSGLPTLLAPKGSLYLRTDGTGVADRLFVATDAIGTWTAVSTAS